MLDAQATAQQLKALLRESKRTKNGMILDDRADAARLDELRRIFAKEHAAVLNVVRNNDQNHSRNSEDQTELSSAQEKWKIYLKQARAKYLAQLSHRIQLGKRTAVRTFWGVVASSPRPHRVRTSSGPPSSSSTLLFANMLDEHLLSQWIQAMCRLPVWDQSIQHMVEAEFVQPYRDVQYYAVKGIAHAAQELYQEMEHQQHENKDQGGDEDTTGGKRNVASLTAERLFQILVLIPITKTQAELDEHPDMYLFAPPKVAVDHEYGEEERGFDSDDDDDDDDSSAESIDEAWSSSNEDAEECPKTKGNSRQQQTRKKRWRGLPAQTASCHAREWSRAWLAVLRLPCLPKHCLKQALQFLPQNVLPVVGQPLLFADFFMSAYSTGCTSSVVPILALDGLFYLMVQHGLEYPQYYTQLYQLITPALLQIRHKTRFLELLDKSISRNELLPAQIVAAMGKRLLRCALTSTPPSSILLSLSLVSNWFRQHPETACLLHRAMQDGDIDDPFDKHATDPAKANALHSSLWELRALMCHYYPAVATLAASLGTAEESQLPLHNALQDFSHLSYPSLLEQERKKRRGLSGKPSDSNSSRTPLTYAPPPKEGLFGSSNTVLGGILARPAKRSKIHAA